MKTDRSVGASRLPAARRRRRARRGRAMRRSAARMADRKRSSSNGFTRKSKAPAAHRFDRAADGAVGGHHDDAGDGRLGQDLVHQGHAVAVGQDQVQQDDARAHGRERRQDPRPPCPPPPPNSPPPPEPSGRPSAARACLRPPEWGLRRPAIMRPALCCTPLRHRPRTSAQHPARQIGCGRMRRDRACARVQRASAASSPMAPIEPAGDHGHGSAAPDRAPMRPGTARSSACGHCRARSWSSRPAGLIHRPARPVQRPRSAERHRSRPAQKQVSQRRRSGRHGCSSAAGRSRAARPAAVRHRVAPRSRAEPACAVARCMARSPSHPCPPVRTSGATFGPAKSSLAARCRVRRGLSPWRPPAPAPAGPG